MTYDADEILGRLRADSDSDWPERLLRRVAEAPLVPEEWLSRATGGYRPTRGELPPAVARVLQAASFGLTNEMIADVFGVSIETVKTELRQGLLRLGAKNRTAACCIALRRGLIQ